MKIDRVPNDSTSFRTAVSMPLIIEAIAITVQTPMTTPIMVKNERSLLARNVLSAIIRFSNISVRTSFISAGHRTQDTGHRTMESGHRKQDTGVRTQESGVTTSKAVLSTQESRRTIKVVSAASFCVLCPESRVFPLVRAESFNRIKLAGLIRGNDSRQHSYRARDAHGDKNRPY